MPSLDAKELRMSLDRALARISDRSAVIGIVGLGYVGLPLATAAARSGFRVLGLDVDPERIAELNAGRSPVAAAPSDELARHIAEGRFEAAGDFARLGECDAVLICVPTPITAQREPDLSHVVDATEAAARALKSGQLVVLESTTWPGTTREIMKPILERGGLKSGEDFFLAFSPEREDPGNARHSTTTIPKVVGGDGDEALELASALYGAIVDKVVAVSSTQTAEAVKLTENIFRSVNIALVNELKMVFSEMGIDVWEVIDAAKTKPFGFMPFYPGPGLGGHCIPIDPFYLTWKAREYDLATRFIELAGQINTAMPRYVVQRLAEELDARFAKGLNGARILLVGVAYKKNVADVRESPALKMLELLEERGADLRFVDPHVSTVRASTHPRHGAYAASEPWPACDAAVIVTDHDAIDYAALVAHAPLVLDTRNACAQRGLRGDTVAAA
ncbi:nucleotide sugar dehydrogenase [Brevundimonas sp.]|uniref:nucleotide sugar dehydrogenase n=1 Tax=Brevundimonas sp. TaxID=1871086 RepID=UPI0035B18F0A